MPAHVSTSPVASKRSDDRRLHVRRVVILAALVALLASAVPAAEALSGQQTCPTSTATSDLTQWCNDQFGSHGGTLAASSWDARRRTFECVCNANTAAALTITQQAPASTTTNPPSTEANSQAASTSQSRSSAAASTSLSTGSSSKTSSDSSDGSSDVFSSVDISLSISHSASSTHASSSVASSDSSLTGTCSWSGVFTPYPDGTQCRATTGVCPRTCDAISSEVCDSTFECRQRSGVDYAVNYTCFTCNGRLYSINSTSASECTRSYTAQDMCDARTMCSGHGCCNTWSTSLTAITCKCYSDGTNGYFTGSSCSSCQNGYEGSSCATSTNRVQFVLASIAKTWTMVTPNMAVLFLFVIFGVTRKLNASDRPFDLTGLRRANLSTVQVARRRQQSLFHSKYIPMRPAKSRSFANPHQPQTRGPPAF